MSDSSEVLLGELPVNTRLMLGSERLRLLVTSTRLVVDHVGKRGPGAVAGGNILGKLSSAFEDLFRSGSESARRRGIDKKSPGEILEAHRDNFAIDYSELVSVTVVQTFPLNQITILTRDDKFEFSTRTRMNAIVDLLRKSLENKLIVQRLSQSESKR